jgi:hypothetical protein
MPKILNIGVARLFNLDRYEHTKISVNVEPGENPGTMLREIQSLIEDLNPACPVEDYQIRDARAILAKPENKEDPFGYSHEDAQKVLDQYEAWQAKRNAAYARLDEMGAAPTVEDIDNTPVS